MRTTTMKTQTFLCLSMVVLGLAACERDPAVLAEQDYRIAHPLTAERQTALAVFDGPIVSDFDRDRLRQLAAQSLRRGAGRVEVTVIASPQEKDEAASVGDGVAAMLHQEGVKEMAVELRLEAGA
jgi:pilus assembly protein CpaD